MHLLKWPISMCCNVTDAFKNKNHTTSLRTKFPEEGYSFLKKDSNLSVELTTLANKNVFNISCMLYLWKHTNIINMLQEENTKLKQHFKVIKPGYYNRKHRFVFTIVIVWSQFKKSEWRWTICKRSINAQI